MILSRSFLFAQLALVAAIAHGDDRQPLVAPRPHSPDEAASAHEAYSPEERERARAEFIQVRKEFADLLVTALTSEELVERAAELSLEVRLRRAKDRLSEIHARLREVEAAGGADSDEARRLKRRSESLKKEIELLKSPEAGQQTGEMGKFATKLAAGRLYSQMEEETDYLADVLEVRELRERARRLRRIVTVARITTGLRQLRQQPREIDEEVPGIVPASGTSEIEKSPSEEDPLGEGTETPPGAE